MIYNLMASCKHFCLHAGGLSDRMITIRMDRSGFIQIIMGVIFTHNGDRIIEQFKSMDNKIRAS